MNGREVFKFATRVLVSSAEAPDECGADGRGRRRLHSPPGECPDHRPRGREARHPDEKVVVNVDRYGNTSSGSIPLALADAQARRAAQERADRADDGHGRRAHVGLGVMEWTQWSCRMTDKVAFCFPGQGRSSRAWAATSRRPCPRRCDVFELGSAASGLDLQRLCFDAHLEELVETEVQQPALVATSLAVLRRAPGPRDQARLRRRPLGRRVRRAGGGRRRSASKRRSRSSASAGWRWRRRRASTPARWPRSSASTTRSSSGSAGASAACGPRTTTVPGSSSSRARATARRRVLRAGRGGGRAAHREAARVRGVPLARSSPARRSGCGPARRARCGFGEPVAPFMSTVTARIESAPRIAPLLVDQLTAPVRFTQAASSSSRRAPARSSRSGRATCCPGSSSASTRA